MDENKQFCCSGCGALNCYRREKSFPAGCIGEDVSKEQLEEIKSLYLNDSMVCKIANAAAAVEGLYYGKLTRVEEIILFAKRIEAKKIGIATCMGLMSEAKTFVKILDAQGVANYCVTCKVGSIDKTQAGLPEEVKIKKGNFEGMCNPILQADLLNKQQTDLNVLLGLCVGHDSLFIKYSNAPVTTLITKDRVLAHNPAAALHTTNSYYSKLLTQKLD